MDMSLSRLRESAMEREAWRAVAHGLPVHHQLTFLFKQLQFLDFRRERLRNQAQSSGLELEEASRAAISLSQAHRDPEPS